MKALQPFGKSPDTCLCILLDSSSLELGLKLSTPVISAGSFGLTCDDTRNLQRLLPPARKVIGLVINFWEHISGIKPHWDTAYVYKKQNNSDDCFWSVAKMMSGTFALHYSLIDLIRTILINQCISLKHGVSKVAAL